MYITQSELEAYLGIQFDWNYVAQTLIDWVESAVNSYIGADWPNWILKTEYTEDIDIRNVILNEDWYNIYVKHWPIDTTKDIYINDMENKVVYNDNPYLIQRWRQIIIKDLDTLLNKDNPKDRWNWFKVKYTAWYWERDEQIQKFINIPWDIQEVCLFLCSVIWITKDYVGMTNYRLWDESISLWRKNFIYDNPIVKETLAKYRKVYIAY